MPSLSAGKLHETLNKYSCILLIRVFKILQTTSAFFSQIPEGAVVCSLHSSSICRSCLRRAAACGANVRPQRQSAHSIFELRARASPIAHALWREGERWKVIGNDRHNHRHHHNCDRELQLDFDAWPNRLVHISILQRERTQRHS